MSISSFSVLSPVIPTLVPFTVLFPARRPPAATCSLRPGCRERRRAEKGRGAPHRVAGGCSSRSGKGRALPLHSRRKPPPPQKRPNEEGAAGLRRAGPCPGLCLVAHRGPGVGGGPVCPSPSEIDFLELQYYEYIYKYVGGISVRFFRHSPCARHARAGCRPSTTTPLPLRHPLNTPSLAQPQLWQAGPILPPSPLRALSSGPPRGHWRPCAQRGGRQPPRVLPSRGRHRHRRRQQKQSCRQLLSPVTVCCPVLALCRGRPFFHGGGRGPLRPQCVGAPHAKLPFLLQMGHGDMGGFYHLPFSAARPAKRPSGPGRASAPASLCPPSRSEAMRRGRTRRSGPRLSTLPTQGRSSPGVCPSER